MPAAAEISSVLMATGRAADPDMTQLIAREISAYGSLDRAAAALANDEAHKVLGELLSYRAALAELADPGLRLARLLREADALDARAEPAWAEAAEFAGRAQFRFAQGQGDLAALFQRRAEAAEQTAAALEAEAFAKRLQAAALRASIAGREALTDVLRTIAA